MATTTTLFNKHKAISLMNKWGQDNIPFIFIISYDLQNSYLKSLHEVPASELKYNFNGISNTTEKQTVKPEPLIWKPLPQPFEYYKQSFDVVHRNLRAGNSFLTNLTCSTPVITNLSLLQAFEHSEAPYRLWWKDRFTVFSPEIFVRITKNKISSYPMKGTIDAAQDNAREILLNDIKESAEHATITDLIRNDLSQVASNVHVKRYRYIDKITTHKGNLLQVSSEIEGTLPHGWKASLGEILFSQLPAGSITGAPKHKTQSIIAEAETYSRNFYTGIMGIFDGENVDSAVMIRFLEQQFDGSLCFKSGGGITFMSDAQSEYNEMIQKIYVPLC